MPSFKFASATGSGSSLIVTCSDQFAGKTITCTNGTKTYTRTCPSTSPYEVVFKGIAPGTWTVSGVVEGRTYSQQVVITDFDVTLTAGFDYKQWVTLGGLDPTDYADLDDVFADEVAVRRLMTIHASADYLIEKVTDDVDEIDDFTANNTAMKWIGLRDYVCDGLTAIAGVEAKFLASAYWERYLKDHVPVMTSNTAPYGTASASTVYQSNSAYYAFDGSDSSHWHANGNVPQNVNYQFTNPICIKKVSIKPYIQNNVARVKDFKIQGSNDNSTWIDIGEGTCENNDNIQEFSFTSNNTYYLYVRLYITSTWSSTASDYAGVTKLQFYGRELSVSVPTMTSNTAPYGTVNVSSQATNYEGFRAFDDTSSFWQGQSPTNQWVSYGFINAPVIKKFSLKANNSGSVVRVKNFKLQASNVADFSDAVNLGVYVQSQNNNVQVFECDNNTPYKYYRIFVLDTYGSSNYVSIDRLQFYGVDYSEREFAEGSTMKYLYDHGVELETLDKYKGSNTTSAIAYNDGNSLMFDALMASNDGYSTFNTVGKTIDLSAYSLLRAKVGNAYIGNNDPANGQKVFNTNGIPSSGTYSNNGVIASRITGGTLSNPNADLAIDLSAINENKWVSIGIFYYRNLKMAITEWWLE